MSDSNTLNNLIAAELSNVAYGTASAPAGWAALSDYSFTQSTAAGTLSYYTYVNSISHQVVIAFKGSDGPLNLATDLVDDGGSAWEIIKTHFAATLQSIKNDPSFLGYQIFTDGHSLGGGLAQTAALEFGLDGYGQNSLPISSVVANDSAISSAGGLVAAINSWRTAHTFHAVITAGDIATWYWTVNKNEAAQYLNQVPTVIGGPWAALEYEALRLNTPVIGIKTFLMAASVAHGIDNVISILQANPSAQSTKPSPQTTAHTSAQTTSPGTIDDPTLDAALYALLSANASYISTALPTFSPTITAGSISAQISPSIVETISLQAETTNSAIYTIAQNGITTNLISFVETSPSTFVFNVEISSGQTTVGSYAPPLAGLTHEYTFLGGNGTLQLTPVVFVGTSTIGTIVNFAPSDAIDITNSSAVSYIMANASGNATMLVIGGNNFRLPAVSSG